MLEDFYIKPNCRQYIVGFCLHMKDITKEIELIYSLCLSQNCYIPTKHTQNSRVEKPRLCNNVHVWLYNLHSPALDD